MPNIKSMNESQLAEKLKDNYDLVRTQAIKDIENLEEISSSIMDKLYELMRKDPFQTVRIAAAKVILLKSSNVEEINIVQNVLSNIKESEFYKENSVVCEALDNMVLTCKSLLLKQIKENEIKLSSDNIPQIPGLEFVPIPGDGHCLFNAVGIYLQEPQDYLRKQVALYFSANKERYRDSVVLGTGTVEDYISRIYSGEEWGTHVEIEILMQIYRRPIIVIESRGVTNPDAINRFPGKPVFVYYNGYDHYNGLIMRQENGEQILNNLLQQDEKRKIASKKISALPSSVREIGVQRDNFSELNNNAVSKKDYQNISNSNDRNSSIDTLTAIRLLIRHFEEKIKQRGVDMRIIGDLMQRAYPDLMAINKRQLIPILGITGSGKSTLFNYLLGCKYKWGIETGQISLTPKPIDVSKEKAKTGSGQESQTMWPIFSEINPNSSDNNNNKYIGDFPGIPSERIKKEEQIFESISTQAAINAADSIKAVIIVVDCKILGRGQHKEFIRLCSLLEKFIQQPQTVASSFLFVFTHSDSGLLEKISIQELNKSIFAKIQDKLKHYKDKLEKKIQALKIPDEHKQAEDSFLRSTTRAIGAWVAGKMKYMANMEGPSVGQQFSIEDPKEMAYLEREFKEISKIMTAINMLSFMKEENTVMVNVCDNGESRNEIFNRLDNIFNTTNVKDIKERFNFNEYDAKRYWWDSDFFNFVDVSYQLMNSYLKLPGEITENEKNVTSYKTEYALHEESLKRLGERETAIKHNAAQVRNLEDISAERDSQARLLLNKQSLYAQIQANIEQNDAIISSRSNWLREIDTSDPILYATDPGRSPPNHIYYFYFFYWKTEISFYYREGVPFVRVEKTPENSFQDEINEPSIGIYKGKYYARGDADVSLKIFVEKRNFRNHPNAIRTYRHEISQAQQLNTSLLVNQQNCQNEINEISEEIARLEAEIANIRQSINSVPVIQDNLQAVQQKIDKKDKEMKNCASSIDMLHNRSKDLEISQLLLANILDQYASLFENVKKLIQCINYKSEMDGVTTVLKKFTELYNKVFEKPEKAQLVHYPSRFFSAEPQSKLIPASSKTARVRGFTTFNRCLIAISQHPKAKLTKPKKGFISYAWGNKYTELVQKYLPSSLRKAGIEIRFDKEHLAGQEPMHQFLDNIPNADVIIVVGTETLRKKYDWKPSYQGECQPVVKAELGMICQMINDGKFINSEENSNNNDKKLLIPLLLEGTKDKSLPPAMHDLVRVEFLDGNFYDGVLKILQSVYGLSNDEMDQIIDPDMNQQDVNEESCILS